MNCYGSLNLIGDDPSPAGEAAMRGTAAHKIIEVMIGHDEHDANDYLGKAVLVHRPGEKESVIYDAGDPATAKYTDNWVLFIADEKMIAGVQLCIDTGDAIRESVRNPEIYSERFLDMSWIDPRLGGTADYTIVEPFGWVHLLDYKNGYVTVDHNDNEQLMTYGVGLLYEHPDCEGVRITVVQPNAFHEEGTVRTVAYTRDELKLHELKLREAAKATAKTNAPRRTGDWCQWCPAKLRCKEHDAMMMEQAQMDFADDPFEDLPVPGNEQPGDDANAELAQKAKWVPVFDRWGKAIMNAILCELMAGNKVPGWKLVRGKANRVIKDTANAIARLTDEAGLDPAELYTEPELKSPAQLEKLGTGKVQRKLVKEIVGEVAHKPDGRLTVADENDPRDAVDATAEAVAEFDDDPFLEE